MKDNQKIFWDKAYTNVNLSVAPEADIVRKWIETYIPGGPGKCIELGCFPGRYLSVLGKLGYELHGVDFTDRVEHDLPAWLRSEGLTVGTFYKGDIFDLIPTLPDRYDIVCSFGLIEHFENWQDLILLHAQLVKANGYIVISVPNFSGIIQRILHFLLDRKNLQLHNLSSMNPKLWEQPLMDNNFEILFSGYFGGFDFWVANNKMNLLQNMLFYPINIVKHFCENINSKRPYSPYAGIIGRRRS